MSHESVEPGRTIAYVLPTWPSDALRTVEFDRFFYRYRGLPFSVQTVDGWSWFSSPMHDPAFTATFRTRKQLDFVIEDASDISLGYTFLNGNLEIQGDMAALLAVAEYVLCSSEGLTESLVQAIVRMSLQFSRRITLLRKSATRWNGRLPPCSVDLPASFFEPWLGPLLGHSSAHFSGPWDDFDTAQWNAQERTCRALSLEYGDRLLDVECGWGSLLLHAASQFGAHGHGVTSSSPQAAFVSERIYKSGLALNCSVDCRDLRVGSYRPQSFDKISHIGIFAQVPFSALSEHITRLCRMLVPGGVLLLHRLTRSPASRGGTGPLHIDCFSEPLSRELEVMEIAGLEVLNVESIQGHYERTLRLWIERLRQSCRRELTDPANRGHRAWLLYLLRVATGLEVDDLRVHQVLLRRPARGSGPRSSLLFAIQEHVSQ